MKLSLPKSFIALLTVMIGCNQPTIPLESLQAESAKALCATYVRCGLAESEQSCRTYFSELLDTQVFSSSPLAKSISEGRIKYDGTAAFQCLEAMKTGECTTAPSIIYNAESQCRKTYTGTVPEGQTCSFSECAPGLYCDFSSANSVCGGKCQKQVAMGATASSPLACEFGTDFRDGKCLALPQEGEKCSIVCATGLSCIAGSCIRPLKAGDACSGSLNCGSGLSCVAGKCALPVGTGEACNTEGGSCKIELTCSAENKCKQAGRDGESCSIGEPCSPLFSCVGATTAGPGTCKARAAEGEGCESGTCRLELFCDLSTKSCKKKLPAGSSCDSSSSALQCENGYCSSGKCMSTTPTCG